MEKDVIISIKGMQKYEDSESDAIEFVTAGHLENSDGSLIISYQESPLTGLEGTLTTLQIEPKRVTMMRVGEVNSQMVFQLGKRHLSMYDTPYGSMAIGINTRRLNAQMGENGGSLEIDYAIEIDHAIAGSNAFRIDVREKSAPHNPMQLVQ